MSNSKTICTVCNYIHDEALGHPKFEALPDEFKCPECGSDKEMFQPCSCVSLYVYEQTHAAMHTPVGTLVAQRPSRACVLEQYGIDYCCGGKTTLQDACKQRGLNAEEVLEKLLAVDSKGEISDEKEWRNAPLAELVDHIVSEYHQPLRQELSRVEHLAAKVAKVHGGNHPEMIEVRDIFNRFKAQLELHMQKEEMVLFPGIKAMESTGSPQIFGCGGGIEHPIQVMGQEHDDAGADLSVLRRLTNDFTAPNDACNTFKALLHSLALIESEMYQHVHKENNILFPRALELAQPVTASR